MILNKLRRVTSSSFYLPHIDGLRFLAIFLVIVQMHVPHYIDDEFYQSKLITSTYWRNWIMEGTNGVVLFFMISGFILALPFARSFVNKEHKIDLKNYYWRRLTRLEPPYLLVLSILFLAHVFIVKKFSFDQLWPHFIASFFYQHNLIYHEFSWVMPVAWTLEIEVQFYVLAPIFCCLFFIQKRQVRLLLHTIIILVSFYLSMHKMLGFRNIFSNLYFFWGGIFLADLYIGKIHLVKNVKLAIGLGVLSFLCFLFMTPQYTGLSFLIKYLFLLLLFHITLTNALFQKVFSGKIITVIGGMCYSIYLTHFAVISAFGELLKKLKVDYQNPLYLLPIYLLFLTLIIIIAAGFFILVEKPFMRYNLREN